MDRRYTEDEQVALLNQALGKAHGDLEAMRNERDATAARLAEVERALRGLLGMIEHEEECEANWKDIGEAPSHPAMLAACDCPYGDAYALLSTDADQAAAPRPTRDEPSMGVIERTCSHGACNSPSHMKIRTQEHDQP